MKLPFWKLQSIGNDFPLVHVGDVTALPPDVFGKLPSPVPETKDDVTSRLSELSIRMCDRHFAIGGDGLLSVELVDGTVLLRMFNPDGTEDFCGNGIRVAAWHVSKLGWVGESFNIKHLDRVVPITIVGNQVRTEIGLATYEPKDVPHTGMYEIFSGTVWTGMDSGVPLSLFGSALSTGSTHTIIQTDKLPDDETFVSVSKKIEVDPKFPKRTSVIWTHRLTPDTLEIRIWERGVGETFGCGTGSTAAAADFMRRRGSGGWVEVRNPGGTVKVFAENWKSLLTIEGEAFEVFEGSFLL